MMETVLKSTMRLMRWISRICLKAGALDIEYLVRLFSPNIQYLELSRKGSTKNADRGEVK